MMDLSIKLTERTGEPDDYGRYRHDTVIEVDARVHGNAEAATRLRAIADMLDNPADGLASLTVRAERL